MKVAISGASGLIGSALVRSLLDKGHIVVKLVRPGGPIGLGSISWDPERGHLEVAALEGFDAVVHLAGENIASRWTEEKKKRIRDSRISGTRLLCSRLKSLENPPMVAVLASAVGIYGDRGDEELTEESPPGRGFLAEVTREWECYPGGQTANRDGLVKGRRSTCQAHKPL
jgi:NAD dependent epimerase/dehydratase family enzyme